MQSNPPTNGGGRRITPRNTRPASKLRRRRRYRRLVNLTDHGETGPFVRDQQPCVFKGGSFLFAKTGLTPMHVLGHGNRSVISQRLNKSDAARASGKRYLSRRIADHGLPQRRPFLRTSAETDRAAILVAAHRSAMADQVDDRRNRRCCYTHANSNNSANHNAKMRQLMPIALWI